MAEIYITRIEGRNFQGYPSVDVSLTNGINIFAGTSDSGKSALLRLTKWVLLNTPSGGETLEEWFHMDETEMFGAVTLSNGYRITRFQSKDGKRREYDLFKDGASIFEHPLTGFGTGIPQEIVEAHGLVPMNNGSYYNFAHQLEAAFMVSDSPTARAKTIGNLEELARIDKALEETNDDIRLERKENKGLSTELKKLKKQAEDLRKEVEEDEVKANLLRSLKEEIFETQQSLRMIARSSGRLQQIQKEIEAEQEIINKSARILAAWDEELPKRVESVTRIRQSLERLRQIGEELAGIRHMDTEKLEELETMSRITEQQIALFQRVKQAQKRLAEIGESKVKIDASFSPRIAALDVSGIDKDIAKFQLLAQQKKKLKDIKEKVELNEAEGQRAEKAVTDALHELLHVLQEHEICPTCSQSTGHLTTKDIEAVV